MKKPDWREWKHMPDVTVWQACALSMDMEPRHLFPDKRKMDNYPESGPIFVSENFASKEEKEEFCLRQRLLLANLPNYTFFPTRFRDRWQGSRREGNSLVRLPEFASWAVSVVMWENMPPELVELASALPRTELSPPTIPPPPISDRQAMLRRRKSVTIAEAAEMLTGTEGWTKEKRAAIDLIREAIQNGELEPESVYYWHQDPLAFDGSCPVINQDETTVTVANFDAWRARTFPSTDSSLDSRTEAFQQAVTQTEQPLPTAGAVSVTLPHLSKKLAAVFQIMRDNWTDYDPKRLPKQINIAREIGKALGWREQSDGSPSRDAKTIAMLIKPDVIDDTE